MLETNCRIIKSGTKIELEVRCIEILAAHVSHELKEKVCSVLANRLGISAISKGNSTFLYAFTDGRVDSVPLDEDNLKVTLKDSDRIEILKFSNPEDRPLIAQLIERQFVISVGQRSDLWRLSDSRRKWYEPKPFKIISGIGAYRRYELSAVPIDNVGIGLVVDISTAFFTIDTIADFFGENQSELDCKRNHKRFTRLSQRQKGQKGTLWYDSGNIDQRSEQASSSYGGVISDCTCYFAKFVAEKTCSTYKDIKVDGDNYESLLEYYHQRGVTSVQAHDSVALVSFSGIDHPQPVAANRLRLRVMNEALPKDLKQVDKIEEEERCRQIDRFWNKLGVELLENDTLRVSSGFWQPCKDKIRQLNCPDLLFGQGKTLAAPADGRLSLYSEYYRQKSKFLDRTEVGQGYY